MDMYKYIDLLDLHMLPLLQGLMPSLLGIIIISKFFPQR